MLVLRKAIVTYALKEGLPNYSNHEATVVLEYLVTDDDTGDRYPDDGASAAIAHAQAEAEAAVMESLARARPAALAAVAADKVNGNGNGNGHGHPIVNEAPPPAPIPAPPPAGDGNGHRPPPPTNRVFGRPTNASQFAGWVNNEGARHKDKVMQLCRKHGYKTFLKELSTEQALWLLEQVDPQGPAY